ncbi:MAG: FkbM family methyltransferase [Anaerolineales bacterium]|nr:FkbM family methyltransferase [Anaerolineales bacterium]
MNWTSVSNTSLIGKILRLPLRLIPPQTVMPVLQGPLRGKRWIVGSGNHGYWLGSYEMGKSARFADAVPAGGTVFDLGANVGYYTLIASLRAGEQGRVFAFEPLPRNLEFLRRHLALNQAGNVTVVGAAVSDRGGTVRFAEDASTSRGRIGPEGGFEVCAVALDEWIESGRLPVPDLLKIDIEGAEFLALQGMEKTLSQSHPPIFLSTHSGKIHKACLDFLAALGYRVFPTDGRPLEKSRELWAAHTGFRSQPAKPLFRPSSN